MGLGTLVDLDAHVDSMAAAARGNLPERTIPGLRRRTIVSLACLKGIASKSGGCWILLGRAFPVRLQRVACPAQARSRQRLFSAQVSFWRRIFAEAGSALAVTLAG